jgi:SAM-dependent methyltransferase
LIAQGAVTAELEACTCPLCSSTAASLTPFANPPYRVLRCGDCGLWYLSPRLTPEAMRACYENDDYFEGGAAGYADYRSQERSLRKTFRMLLAELARRGATGGALLDVGAGLGYLLDEARPHFAERTGIELAPAAAVEATTRSGARVLPSLAALDAAARFDCIVAAHVVEHIHAPLPFVQTLVHHLRPGGALVLAAPDMGGLLRRLMGRRWPSFKYPEHVSYFDALTLQRLMCAAGLGAPERLPYPHAFPLALILGKLGLPSPVVANRIDATLPATTVCYLARRSEDPAR